MCYKTVFHYIETKTSMHTVLKSLLRDIDLRQEVRQHNIVGLHTVIKSQATYLVSCKHVNTHTAAVSDSLSLCMCFLPTKV